MKKILMIACALTVSTMSMAAEKYMINPKDTQIEWTGSKSLVDSKHNGTIDIKEGYLEFKKGKLLGGELVIDMSTIKNEDLKDPKYNQKLVGHLNSDDFFNVQKYPTASYNITKVEATKEKDTYNIVGDLTIKGVTKSYTVENVKVSEKKGVVTIEPSIAINRKDYGITYNAESTFEKVTDAVKDKIIADNFTLDMKLVASAKDKKAAK